jgi:hypothetical protein
VTVGQKVTNLIVHKNVKKVKFNFPAVTAGNSSAFLIGISNSSSDIANNSGELVCNGKCSDHCFGTSSCGYVS